LVKGDFGDAEGAESAGFSHGELGLVVEALDAAAGELLSGGEMIEMSPRWLRSVLRLSSSARTCRRQGPWQRNTNALNGGRSRSGQTARPQCG
jgi:hypothetical protein